MPQPTTLTKHAKKMKRGVGASRLRVDQNKIEKVEVDLGDGDILVLSCRDLSVGNVRGFMRAARDNDMDVIATEFLKIVTDWETYDDLGNLSPVMDEQTGEVWPLTDETVDTLELAVFQEFAGALGKRG